MTAFWCSLLPALALALGTLGAPRVRGNASWVAQWRLLAMGAVVAAATVGLMPSVLHASSPVTVLLGGGAGVAVALALRRAAFRAAGPRAPQAVRTLDLGIKGLVLGLVVATNVRIGALFAATLALEALLTGLLPADRATGPSPSPARRLSHAMAGIIALPMGALLTVPLAGPPPAFAEAMSFGLLALLTVVVHDLLAAEPGYLDANAPEPSTYFMTGFLTTVVLEASHGCQAL